METLNFCGQNNPCNVLVVPRNREYRVPEMFPLNISQEETQRSDISKKVMIKPAENGNPGVSAVLSSGVTLVSFHV